MSIRSRLLIWLSRSLLNKLQKTYRHKFDTELPIILVTGTAGKSSITLLLRELFEKSGWLVYSGATKNSCLNSVVGLPMVLGNFSVRFESPYGRLAKAISYFWQGLEILWFGSYRKIEQKTILIYECGYDQQNESEQFLEIFEHIDLLVTTAVTPEHTMGYENQFDTERYFNLHSDLPKHWQETLEDTTISGTLRNTALEQFSLISIADNYILPAAIGEIDNTVISNLDNHILTHNTVALRNEEFAIVADQQFTFSPDYLLPLTFARNAHILALVSEKFNLSTQTIQTVLNELSLPAGRFSVLHGILDSTIVDSTYNSDPASVRGFLELLTEVMEVSKLANEHSIPPKHYLVLGEMRELGDSATEAHQMVLDQIIELGAKYAGYLENIMLLGREWLACDDTGVVKTNERTSFVSYKKQLFKVYLRAGDINELLNEQTIRPHSWIWLKGSQNTIFLEIVAEHLLADKKDADKLCRRGDDWDEIRAKWAS